MSEHNGNRYLYNVRCERCKTGVPRKDIIWTNGAPFCKNTNACTMRKSKKIVDIKLDVLK